MAGYIFNFDNINALIRCLKFGVYATRNFTPKNNKWLRPHEGTFADYASMKEDDDVYFFIKRKIFGIGKLVNIGRDCKYFNFPGAGQPKVYDYKSVKPKLLWDEGRLSVGQRMVCFFKPGPCFFKEGIDMDDALSFDPGAFRMLRAFWKLSFVKFGDEENNALKSVLLKRNEDASDVYKWPFDEKLHERIAGQIDDDYEFSTAPMLKACADGDSLDHEMAIELDLVAQLSRKKAKASLVFGVGII